MKQPDIERLLPGVFQRGLDAGNPLRSVLGLMESMHEPSERILEQLDRFFDPRRTSDPFVPYLAGWVGLNWIHARSPDDFADSRPRPFPPGTGRLGELVAWSAYHTRWRGTARGLVHFLETATGASGFEVDDAPRDEDGTPIPYHMRVRIPGEVETLSDLIRRIVDHEKPAHVTYEVDVAAHAAEAEDTPEPEPARTET
jgi:phage tail-like protein